MSFDEFCNIISELGIKAETIGSNQNVICSVSGKEYLIDDFNFVVRSKRGKQDKIVIELKEKQNED